METFYEHLRGKKNVSSHGTTFKILVQKVECQ
jgi:hypothetical protein